MPITIGNGLFKSEILINPLWNTKETCCKVFMGKIKDFFFLLAKAKADRCLHEMLFCRLYPTRERLTEIFFV